MEADEKKLTDDERFWILNQRIRQTRFDQLTSYYKLWVIAVEAFMNGVALFWLAALAIPPYSTAAVLADTTAIVQVAAAGLVGITALLRVVWIAVTGDFPAVGRIEDWDI